MKTCIHILSLFIAAQVVSRAELAAHWSMDETTHGSTIADSVHGLAGTPTAIALDSNGLVYGQPSVAAGTYGAITVTTTDAAKFGTSIQFVRTGSGMFQIGNPAVIGDLAGPGLSGAFTVMAWVNASISSSSNQRIFATGAPNGWGVGLSNVDRVLFTAFGVSDQRSAVASSNNVWQHVAYTWNAGAIEAFINGVSVFTATVSNFNDETNPQFGIGGNGNGGDNFNGRIDELKIYDGVLSPAEIAAAALPAGEIDPLLVVATAIVLDNNGAPQTFSIPFSNGGSTETLTVASVTLGGFDEDLFTVEGFTESVAPGESGSIGLGFTPFGNGTFEVDLVIASNDAIAGVKTVKITVHVTDPVIAVSAGRVDFGELAGNPGPQTMAVTLTNEGGSAPLDIYDAIFLGQGGNGFRVVSKPEFLEPGESGDVVIEFDPGSATGDFGDLMRIETNAANTPNLVLPVVAKVDFSAGTAPVGVVNGDFDASGWNSLNGTSPHGWANSRAATSANGFYGQGGGTGTGETPGLTSIAAHFQSYAGYYEQNLSLNNPGLAAGAVEAVTVTFDRVYRNDAATNGHAMLRVSLWDATNDAEIAGRDVVFEDPGVRAGNDLTPVAFRLSYDASAYENEEIALRITRIPPLLTAGFSQATLVIDNVSVAVDGDWEPSDAYSVWALAAGLDGSPGRESGPGDDPDGDGVLNFDEFAFGGDPLSGTSGGVSAVAAADTTGDSQPELILTLAVRADAAFSGGLSPVASANGVSYAIEGSFDLVGFNAAVEGPLAVPVVPASLPAEPPAGYKYVSFRLAESNGLPGKGFLRARAEIP